MRLFFILFLFAAPVFATINHIGTNRSPVKAQSALEGRWELVDRACSSGAVPLDNFIFGRDYADYTFNGKLVTSYVRIQNCETVVTGSFEVFGQQLSIYPQYYQSQCGPIRLPFRENFSMKLDLAGVNLSLVAPMHGPGGTCPGFDSIELKFQKF